MAIWATTSTLRHLSGPGRIAPSAARLECRAEIGACSLHGRDESEDAPCHHAGARCERQDSPIEQRPPVEAEVEDRASCHRAAGDRSTAEHGGARAPGRGPPPRRRARAARSRRATGGRARLVSRRGRAAPRPLVPDRGRAPAESSRGSCTPAAAPAPRPPSSSHAAARSSGSTPGKICTSEVGTRENCSSGDPPFRPRARQRLSATREAVCSACARVTPGASRALTKKLWELR